MGAAVAPKGSFPWMVSLFVLLKNGEALFMCAGALITPNLAVTAAHCFTNNEKKTTWYEGSTNFGAPTTLRCFPSLYFSS